MFEFKITKVYSEKLTIYNFLEGNEKNQNIPLNISYRGFIENDKFDENILKFKVYFDVESLNFPISLNWVGVFILEFDSYPTVINVEDLFEDKNIQECLNKFIKQFSMNLIGKLPSFTEMMENKKSTTI